MSDASDRDFQAVTHAFSVLGETADWLDGIAQVLTARVEHERSLMEPEPCDDLTIEKEQVEKLIGALGTAANNVRSAIDVVLGRRA